ncbi:protein of unknown function [Candidatus Methylocalor cossyra]|uniref:Secreted protein n=1 Tax=Candidatus Methylocalor cossyra TaxID=3108543 RepID=A0ABM9NKQ8_9GAMM
MVPKIHHLFLFRFLLFYDFIGVSNTFTFIWFRCSIRPNIRCNLANLSLIASAHNNFRLRRRFYGYTLRYRIVDSMRKSYIQSQYLPSRLCTVSYAY